jgi:hypothetical protein
MAFGPLYSIRVLATARGQMSVEAMALEKPARQKRRGRRRRREEKTDGM